MRIQIITILAFSLTIYGCSSDSNKTDSGTIDADGSQPEDEGTQERATRVLFIVDTSQSMAVDDPGLMRKTEVERAVNRYLADPMISFAIMQMSTQATLLSDGFTSSAEILDQAAQNLDSASGTASYSEALGLARTTLEEDMGTVKPLPNGNTRYRIFILTDSMFEAGITGTDVIDDLSSLLSLKTEHGVMEIRVHTALLIDPSVNVQQSILADLTEFLKTMANIGQGTFTDYHDSEEIDFMYTIAL